MAAYVRAFAAGFRWPPSQLESCRIGDLDALWRDLLHDPMTETQEGD